MNAVHTLIDRVTRKDWADADIDKMVGDADHAYLVHANNAAVRDGAASGGATSALLIHALEIGAIDGAIVCRSIVVDGKVRAAFRIARTAGDILAARGSKYVETKFLSEVLPLIRGHHGRLAVCGLPCDIAALRRREAKEPALAHKIALRVTFLCGHNSRTELIDGITEKLSREAGGSALKDYTFRSGRWRGELTAMFDSGETIKKPFSYFSDYRNLHFFSERKCIACTDHFGYVADLSIGDVWLFAHKNDRVKKSAVLARNGAGAALVESAIRADAVTVERVDRRTILDGQTRIAPTHYNVSARAKAGRVLGVKLNDTVQEPTPPHKWLSAFLGLWNMKLSEGPQAHWIFKIPRPLIRGYLFFKKGLESVK